MEYKFRVGREQITVRENAVDRVVRYVAPSWARERLGARVQLALAGGYKGASTSKRGLSNWNPKLGSADADILPDLSRLRDRSRDLVRNNPLAAGALNTATTGVVGTGLMPKPAPHRGILGWTEEQAAKWKEAVEPEFAIWADSPFCDLTLTQNFYGLQDLAFRSSFESGDSFGLLPMVERGAAYDLAIQLIEADRCSNPDSKPDTRSLVNGVKLNGYGAPVGYCFSDRHPGDRILGATGMKWQEYAAFGPYGRSVMHVFARRRIGQTRGVPWLAAALPAFKQLGDYTEAEIFAAVANAMFAVVSKTESRGGISPLESAVTGDTPASGTADAAQSNWDGTLTAGLAIDLGVNEDIHSFNAGRPNPEFDPFVQAILRQIGVSLELPFEVLVKHFTASYSAARSALLEAWKFYRTRRAWLVETFCQPAYEAWMAEAVARGTIQAPGFFDDPRLRYAYTCAAWHGDGPGAIDPSKEADAAKTRMEIHLTSLDEEKAAYDGGDALATIEQRGREKQALDRAGLAPTAAPVGAPPGDGSDDDRPAAPEQSRLTVNLALPEKIEHAVLHDLPLEKLLASQAETVTAIQGVARTVADQNGKIVQVMSGVSMSVSKLVEAAVESARRGDEALAAVQTDREAIARGIGGALERGLAAVGREVSREREIVLDHSGNPVGTRPK